MVTGITNNTRSYHYVGIFLNCVWKMALMGLHNETGHPGIDRTISLVKDRFYWPGMNKAIGEWIQSCDRYY